MLRTITCILLIAFSHNLKGQTLHSWKGALSLGSNSLRLNIHIESTTSGCKATLDSPDQGAYGIAFAQCHLVNDSIYLSAPQMMASYSGRYVTSDSIHGVWAQGGMELSLNLTPFNPDSNQTSNIRRPQTPRPPFSYSTEEVTFRNEKEGITLSGTLTLPEVNVGQRVPAVVLISGSGPQNRDEEIFGHKPFAVIADDLTKRGIAVLRYDDRGTGASGGDFRKANSEDLSKDAQAAWEFLARHPHINVSRIGLIGHSEGGFIAAMIAARNKKVAFIISLAGPGIPHDQLLMEQTKALTPPDGEDIEKMLAFNQDCYTLIKTEKDPRILETLIRKRCMEYYVSGNSDYPEGKKAAEKQAEALSQAILSPWFIYFIRCNPADYWKKVKCPVLALNGELDRQVLPVSNLRGIQKALPKNTRLKSCFIEMNQLNHLFQPATTGKPEEYSEITTTFSESALKVIGEWLEKTVK
jgi:pimeloyl-ACP methyl ester carboxylesterase